MKQVFAAILIDRGLEALREKHGKWVFNTARAIEQESMDKREDQISGSVEEEAARNGAPVFTSYAQQAERFSGGQRAGAGARS